MPLCLSARVRWNVKLWENQNSPFFFFFPPGDSFFWWGFWARDHVRNGTSKQSNNFSRKKRAAAETISFFSQLLFELSGFLLLALSRTQFWHFVRHSKPISCCLLHHSHSPGLQGLHLLSTPSWPPRRRTQKWLATGRQDPSERWI